MSMSHFFTASLILMAKHFLLIEIHVVHTSYGYFLFNMSPEYAIHGEFSIKTDVYSFGVLILEIITGKKITSFRELGFAEDLLSYVS